MPRLYKVMIPFLDCRYFCPLKHGVLFFCFFFVVIVVNN
jgi:hypothetical protein